MSDTYFPHLGPARPDLQSDTGQNGSDNALPVRGPVSRIGRIPLRAQPTWDDGQLSETHSPKSDQRFDLSGRRGASGGGDPHGDLVRPARSRGDSTRPNFDLHVPEDGYAWWYVDGLSDDDSRAISIIGFIGSVFSPWYRWSGRRNPANHCCINVAT